MAPAGTAQACHWKVIWPTAGVYATPGRTTAPVKTKHAGDIVGQSCAPTRNPSENETYIQVTLADGGTGWMRASVGSVSVDEVRDGLARVRALVER